MTQATRSQKRGPKRVASPSPAPPCKKLKGKQRIGGHSGLSTEEAKMLKQLEVKHKAASAAAIEVEKQKIRKRTATLLAEDQETEDQEQGAQDEEEDSDLEAPRPARHRSRQCSRLSSGRNTNLDSLWSDPPVGDVDSDGQADQNDRDQENTNEQDPSGEGGDGGDEGEDEENKDEEELVASDHWHEINEIVVGLQDDEKNTASTTCCHAKGQKVRLANFTSPRSHKLAKLAHGLVRRYVSLTDSFPLAVQREDVCWKALLEAGRKDTALRSLIKSTEGDLDKKANLIDYAWGGATQLRGELVAKARLAVPHAYALPGGLKGDELNSAIKWLVEQGKMLHSGVNVKECTCDEDGPWGHPIFAQLIKAQWWGQRGEGTKLGSSPSNPYFNAPIPQLALVASAVDCVLTGMSNGTVIEFNDSLFRTRWEHYVALLKQFQENCPSYLQNIQKKIQEETGFKTAVISNLTYDFTNLEAKAKCV